MLLYCSHLSGGGGGKRRGRRGKKEEKEEWRIVLFCLSAVPGKLLEEAQGRVDR